MKTFKILFLAYSVLFLSYGMSADAVLLPPNVEPGTLFGAAADFCEEPGGAGPSTLYSIDPDNGNTTEIGPIGFNAVSGLAFLPDGRLVGSARNDANGERISILIEIDPSTGQGTLIGQVGNNTNPGECGRVPDLTYDPFNDTLFGLGERCPTNDDDSLITIDPISGAGIIIGMTGFDGSGNGIALVNNREMFLASNSELYAIRRATGNTTFIGNIDASINALAFNALTGQLFGSDFDGLYTVNTSQPSSTFVGDLPECFDALVFAPSQLPTVQIPTLSQWGLIATAGVLGFISFITLRRRKVTA